VNTVQNAIAGLTTGMMRVSYPVAMSHIVKNASVLLMLSVPNARVIMFYGNKPQQELLTSVRNALQHSKEYDMAMSSRTRKICTTNTKNLEILIEKTKLERQLAKHLLQFNGFKIEATLEMCDELLAVPNAVELLNIMFQNKEFFKEFRFLPEVSA
jgi:hypothetical protein